jgi:hypothetical protein
MGRVCVCFTGGDCEKELERSNVKKETKHLPYLLDLKNLILSPR